MKSNQPSFNYQYPSKFSENVVRKSTEIGNKMANIKKQQFIYNVLAVYHIP